MEAQGYQVQDNILFQDNKSTILLEKNGKALSSKRTKHVNIRYFFITNRIDKGDVSLVWCLTGDMIRDFMTKPLQGALFRKFRDQIMGVVPAQDPGPGKAITKIDELNTHTVKPTKGNELKPSRGTIYNLVLSKEGRHHVSVAELFHCKFHHRNNRQTNMDQNAKSWVTSTGKPKAPTKSKFVPL
jgi:hypothetical protein